MFKSWAYILIHNFWLISCFSFVCFLVRNYFITGRSEKCFVEVEIVVEGVMSGDMWVDAGRVEHVQSQFVLR